MSVLAELSEQDWVRLDAPKPSDGSTTIGRYNETPVKRGVVVDEYVDSGVEHVVYQTGPYKIHVRIYDGGTRSVTEVNVTAE